MSEEKKGPKAGGKVSRKLAKYRRSRNVRIGVILFLMAVVAFLFFWGGKFKIFLGGIFVVLALALGLETSGNDWDLGKLVETGSFEESKVRQTSDGFWAIGDDCNGEIDYNCDNFEYREDAQSFFDNCGGVENDVSRLDGNGDGEACESLPSNPAYR